MKLEVKTLIRNIIFFVIIFIFTYMFIFSKINVKEISRALSNSNLILIFAAIVLSFNNIIFEAINLKRNFKLLGDNVKFTSCLKYSIIGFFFSSITPATTGGQPMQIYTMSKDDIEFSHGATALFTPYICYMITAVLLAIVGFIVNYSYISEIKFFKYLIYIGLGANTFITLIVIIAMFAPTLSRKCLKFVNFIIKKVNPSKAAAISKKIEHQLDEYHKSAVFVISHKFATLKTFLIAFFQIISIHSVAYFTFWALGYHDYPYIRMLLLQSVVFISVSAIPLPGTIGVSESGFAIMYKSLFPITIVETSMILSRSISFYLLVIVTGTIILLISIRNRFKQRK